MCGDRAAEIGREGRPMRSLGQTSRGLRSRAALLAMVSTTALVWAPGQAFARKKHAGRTQASPVAPVTEEGAPAAATTVVAPPVDKEAVEVAPAVPPVAAPRLTEPPPPPVRESHSTETITSAHGAPSEASVANQVEGHVGVASPLITFRGSKTVKKVTSVGDDFTLVAPIGLGMRIGEAWTFDFEFQIATGVRPEGLTTAIVDPGVLYSWGVLGAGLRVAWQLNVNQNVGVIPLVNATLMRTRRASWFVEAAVPTFVQNKTVTLSGSLHTGVGF
jgi:hypothetical protein